MKLLCVEDNFFKRNHIGGFFEEKGIILEEFEFINPALEYIIRNKANISGIILDLSLKSSMDSNDYDLYKGVEVITELEKLKIQIPILINSSLTLDLKEGEHPYVFAHRRRKNDYKILEDFISFLKEREKQ